MTPSENPGHVSDAISSYDEVEAPDPDFPHFELTDFTDRLKTFTNWPSTFLSKEALAAAGFYYTGEDDIVKCAFCKVKIGRWERHDDPEAEHRKYSCPTKCKFLLWSRTTTRQNSFLSNNEVNDTCGPLGLDGVKDSILKYDKITRATLGNSYHNSTYVSVDEEYVYYDDRLNTFSDWPHDSQVTKEALSEAGFIFRHNDDCTSCFHCGGTLRKWEENDDPWEEHAGWFPDCKYVLTLKGQKFINAARAKKQAINTSLDRDSERVVLNRPDT